MFYLESVWPKRRMERGIVPENNYLTNYIVSNILKRIDLELKNKVRKYPFRGYPSAGNNFITYSDNLLLWG